MNVLLFANIVPKYLKYTDTATVLSLPVAVIVLRPGVATLT
jgi:hypothetical protein